MFWLPLPKFWKLPLLLASEVKLANTAECTCPAGTSVCVPRNATSPLSLIEGRPRLLMPTPPTATAYVSTAPPLPKKTPAAIPTRLAAKATVPSESIAGVASEKALKGAVVLSAILVIVTPSPTQIPVCPGVSKSARNATSPLALSAGAVKTLKAPVVSAMLVKV